MLPASRAVQCFQVVAGRRRKYPQFGGRMQLEQFSESDTLDIPEALAALVGKKALRFLRAKALDHLLDYTTWDVVRATGDCFWFSTGLC
jgi:hypothetical protein